MKYEINEGTFDGITFPSNSERQQIQTKYEALINEIGHVPDKNMADFLFASYVYLLEAKANGDNRITPSEMKEIKSYCREYMDTYDLNDNMLFEAAFGLNKYHKERWSGYLSHGRMKHIVKTEMSPEPRVTSAIEYNDLLNSEPLKFAYDVVADKSQTYWVRLQAKKFIEDFTVNQFKPDFEYYFNADVLRVIEIFLRQINLATAKDVTLIGDSIVNHVKPFQYFMLMNVFSWRRKDKFAENRYQKFVLFIPRKNGKSWFVAVVKMLGLILLPNESELFSASNTRDQAMQIRKEFENICGASPSIARYFKINRDVIQALHSNSEFKVLAGKPKDGSLPSIAAIDENGDAEPDNINASSLEKGMSGSFKLLFYVSTAYAKYPSGMSVEVETAKTSLSPESDYLNEELFAMLYTAQEPNIEWTSHEALKATNPLMWEVDREALISDQRTATMQEHKQNEFKTKRLNIFLATNTGTSIAPIENLKACYNSPPDFNWHGRQCILGIDLSMGDDNSAINLVTFDDGKYYVKQWVFIPEGRIDNKNNIEKIDYRNWIRKGQTFATIDHASNNEIINYKEIEEFIINLPNEYGVEITHIAYDQYNASNLIQNLQKHSIFYTTQFEIIPQSKTGRHFGISLLRQVIMQKRLFFDNSMMIHEWGAVEMKQTDNLYYVEKVNTAKNKTDIIYSLINALCICSEMFETTPDNFVNYVLELD